MNTEPDYKKIYTDIITKKFPHKMPEFEAFLEKDELSVLEVIQLNDKIFGTDDRTISQFNSKHRAYNKATILDILNYQKENNLNNTELAKHFKLSRNSVTKWKKIFADN